MYKNALRPAWVEINLDNLDFNIEEIKSLIPQNCMITAIVKADAYGHGAVQVAKTLIEHGIISFGVATLEEAISLRNSGIEGEIVVLGLTSETNANIIVSYHITPVIDSLSLAQAISNAATSANTSISGYVALDTGMCRIGYSSDNLSGIDEIKKISNLCGFKIKGLFSHFATADESDKTFAKLQGKKFENYVNALENVGVTIHNKTIANSAAIMEMPYVLFDVARPGIILYGCQPSDQVSKNIIPLRPVMSVRGRIMRLRKVPAETFVSYGRNYTTKKESLIATVALGYADGFPRVYSSLGKVLVNEHFAPIAGNICMDQCMIDVTNIPNVKKGNFVTLMGTEGNNSITAEDIAAVTGTINYEILCAFGQRLPKVYLRQGESI